MSRGDKRLDSVRSECYGLIENMALERISKNEYFQNLDSDSLQNAFVGKVERLEKLVSEDHPQFIGLVEFCMSLCLNTTEHRSKITRCPTHFSDNNKAKMDLNFRMGNCAVCRSMIQQLVSLSKKNKAKTGFGVDPRIAPPAMVEDHLYGGTSHFDSKLTSIVTEFSSTYNKIILANCSAINQSGFGSFFF